MKFEHILITAEQDALWIFPHDVLPINWEKEFQGEAKDLVLVLLLDPPVNRS